MEGRETSEHPVRLACSSPDGTRLIRWHCATGLKGKRSCTMELVLPEVTKKRWQFRADLGGQSRCIAGVELHAEAPVPCSLGAGELPLHARNLKEASLGASTAVFFLSFSLFQVVAHTDTDACRRNPQFIPCVCRRRGLSSSQVEARCRRSSAPAVVMQVRLIVTYCQSWRGLHGATSATLFSTIRPGMLGAGDCGRSQQVGIADACNPRHRPFSCVIA